MSGWKTVVVGAGFAIFGIVLIVNGQTEKGIENILIGAGLITGRMAVEKVIKK